LPWHHTPPHTPQSSKTTPTANATTTTTTTQPTGIYPGRATQANQQQQKKEQRTKKTDTPQKREGEENAPTTFAMGESYACPPFVWAGFVFFGPFWFFFVCLLT